VRARRGAGGPHPNPLPKGEGPELHIFRVDSLHALADAQNGLQPRGEFADLLDLLTGRWPARPATASAGPTSSNWWADTLDACRTRVDQSLPKVREVQTAIDQERTALAQQIAGQMQADCWWPAAMGEPVAGPDRVTLGLSPFSLVLRVYQGIGGLLSGALLYRSRTPAQMALWGAVEGVRTWRKHHQADRGIDRATLAASIRPNCARPRSLSRVIWPRRGWESWVGQTFLSAGDRQECLSSFLR